ncbi:MAG: hypothetical protein A2Z83_01395 [Omnitrophica bacterium GWA2_52_8]|nr:MAG: hypothetical protein A2Z83_01395 [Omnitrophica bacterium GWA2_52_8]
METLTPGFSIKAEKKDAPCGKTPRVSILAGPSGGHLFPAVAFAEYLRTHYPGSILSLVTGKKGSSIVQSVSPGLFNHVLYLEDFPFLAAKPLRWLLSLWHFLGSFVTMAVHFWRTSPELVAGFGSYVSFPGVYLAHLSKIPTLIHEQNLIPGKATQWLVRCADLVCVTFEATFAGIKLKRREVVGLPLRAALYSAREHSPEPPGPRKTFRILIVGGSQGARRINEAVLQAFKLMTPAEKANIAVTHITGMQDASWVAEEARRLGVEYRVNAFSSRMQDLYGEADMAITRAGANTLFELALFKVPAVVIPYPHAAQHQRANAVFFSERQAVFLQDETQLTPQGLLQKIKQLQNNPDLRARMSHSLAQLGGCQAPARMAVCAEALWKRSN